LACKTESNAIVYVQIFKFLLENRSISQLPLMGSREQGLITYPAIWTTLRCEFVTLEAVWTAPQMSVHSACIQILRLPLGTGMRSREWELGLCPVAKDYT
jgi:hypothetical protein